MSIRESIQKNKGVFSAAAVVLILACIGWSIFYQVQASTPNVQVDTKAFYTYDEGATYFADVSTLIPPVEINGREALMAHVFEVDGQEQVVYLERYTPEGKANLIDFRKRRDAARKELEEFVPPPNATPADFPVVPQMNGAPPGRELKLVGSDEWVLGASDAGREIERSASMSGRRVKPS
ncbi:MAG: hypothetical protein AAF743_07205 [Planctomycetota bacterium]